MVFVVTILYSIIMRAIQSNLESICVFGKLCRGLAIVHLTLDIVPGHYLDVVEDQIIQGFGPTAAKSKIGYLLSGPIVRQTPIAQRHYSPKPRHHETRRTRPRKVLEPRSNRYTAQWNGLKRKEITPRIPRFLNPLCKWPLKRKAALVIRPSTTSLQSSNSQRTHPIHHLTISLRIWETENLRTNHRWTRTTQIYRKSPWSRNDQRPLLLPSTSCGPKGLFHYPSAYRFRLQL